MMLVCDLIAELRKVPPEAEVWIRTADHLDCVDRVGIDEEGDVILAGEL